MLRMGWIIRQKESSYVLRIGRLPARVVQIQVTYNYFDLLTDNCIQIAHHLLHDNCPVVHRVIITELVSLHIRIDQWD